MVRSTLLTHKRHSARGIRGTATYIRWRSQCLCKRTPSALAVTVEPIGPGPNREGQSASVDLDHIPVDRLIGATRLDRNHMIPLLDQRIMLVKMNFEVFVVDLLHMQC